MSATIGAITRHIRDHDLMPGDRLPSESSLSRDLNVSRTVVREAFRSLATLRIIDISGGRRATVAQIDHGAMSLMIEHGVQTDQISVQQVYDVRRAIETRIATLAAIRRSDTEAAAIRELAAEMRAARDEPLRLLELDLAYHALLAQACRNPLFRLIVAAFEGITRQTWLIGWKSRVSPDDRETMLATHEGIAEAVLAGDPVLASELMAVHFDESLRALVAAGMN